MYQAHVERLRTTAAFIKIFIFRHLFFSANLNLARQPPRIDYRDEMVKWCRELLLSQRKMIQRGDYTDFGSVMSYQLSQTGRGLIPAIYITSRLMDPSQDPNSNTILKEAQELLVLAYDLLRQLSDRFTASNRQLQIMQSAFRRLDLSLRKRHHKVGATGAHDPSSHSHGAAEHGRDDGVGENGGYDGYGEYGPTNHPEDAPGFGQQPAGGIPNYPGYPGQDGGTAIAQVLGKRVRTYRK